MKKRSITPSAAQRKDYGRRLSEAIERAGKSQAWIAEQLHCTEAQISKMCKHGAGGLWAFAQACDVIGASLDYVVLGTYPRADDFFMDKLRQLMATASSDKSGVATQGSYQLNALPIRGLVEGAPERRRFKGKAHD